MSPGYPWRAVHRRGRAAPSSAGAGCAQLAPWGVGEWEGPQGAVRHATPLRPRDGKQGAAVPSTVGPQPMNQIQAPSAPRRHSTTGNMAGSSPWGAPGGLVVASRMFGPF